MKKNILAGSVIAASLAMTGCFSSSDFDPSSTPLPGAPGSAQTQPGERSGQAMNTYLLDATVCVDLNFNAKCDANEPSTKTGAEGRFTLETTNVTAPTLVILGDNLLQSPAGSTIVSPITTVINAVFQKNLAEGQSVNSALLNAKNLVSNALQGASDGGVIDLLTTDYVALEDSTSEGKKIAGTSRLLNLIIQEARVETRNSATSAGLNPDNLTAQINQIVNENVVELLEELAGYVSDRVDAGLEIPEEGDPIEGFDVVLPEEPAEVRESVINATNAINAAAKKVNSVDPTNEPVEDITGVTGSTSN